MNKQLALEEKHNSLKNELSKKLQKKQLLEIQISHEFERLKKVEISLEKCAQAISTKG